LNNKKPNIRITRADFPDTATLFDLDSMEQLEALRNKEAFIESEYDIFLVKKPNIIFRYTKPNTPKIISAKDISINPDSCSVKVELTEHDLLDFCKREHLFCFQRENELVLALGEIIMFAKKEPNP